MWTFLSALVFRLFYKNSICDKFYASYKWERRPSGPSISKAHFYDAFLKSTKILRSSPFLQTTSMYTFASSALLKDLGSPLVGSFSVAETRPFYGIYSIIRFNLYVHYFILLFNTLVVSHFIFYSLSTPDRHAIGGGGSEVRRCEPKLSGTFLPPTHSFEQIIRKHERPTGTHKE